MERDADIVVAGGGIAGMMATLVLANTGARVICVEAGPADPPTDLRSTAFLMPAVNLLSEIGLMDRLRPVSAALRTMRIVEAGTGQITRSVDFVAREAGEADFGWNIPNAALRQLLPGAIADSPNASLRPDTRVLGQTPRLNETILRLSDGTRLRTRLLVAADGRDSTLREQAGISAIRTHYGQKALVFTIAHDLPHDNVSTEVHLSGGPFTLVPLPGPDQTASAVVWMDTGPNIAALQDLPPQAFAARVNARSFGILGPLTVTSDIAAWPIISQYASRLSAPRMALLGETAHVVPPIGAQGLNMSLADAAALRDLLRAEPADCGAPALLDRYHKRRWPDIRMRVQGIDALNRASMTGNPLGQSLRAAGLGALQRIAPLRKTAIRSGLGV